MTASPVGRSVGLVLTGLALLLLSAIAPWAQTPPETQPAGTVARILEVEGPIGPPLADYVVDGITTAREDGVELVILEMDTPGGLDSSMRRIIKAILASPVPVASYVSPSGARAASAGTYILYASHIAAMAPGTNLGAATPVQLGGMDPLPGQDEPTPRPDEDPGTAEDQSPDSESSGGESGEAETAEEDVPAMSNQDSMRAKVINDAAAYIQGLAELRGRNVEWAVSAVREASSLSYREAADLNVIDFVAANLSDLLAQSDGRTVSINGEDAVVESAGAVLEREEPGLVTRILAAITDPNVAFLLMTLGFYGLFFELANPGALVPGTAGVICLILGLYALSVLPVSYAGAALIAAGVVLMVLEAFAPSFGALGIGGLAAFALGATMLFDTDVPEFQLSWQVIAVTTIATGGFLLFVVMFALGAQTRRVVTGVEYLVRQIATVESWDGDHGWVLVEGERWRAVSDRPLQPGQKVRILDVDHLTLKVKPA